MHQCFSLSSSSLLLFFFLNLQQNPYLINAVVPNLVDKTCKKCINLTVCYDFCLTSLQAVPISNYSNLPGLALIAMELAIKNCTNTISTIKKLIRSKSFDLQSLEDCLELYSDASIALEDSIRGFLSEHYESVIRWLRGTMVAATACEERFLVAGNTSPLITENYCLFQLTDIANCITMLLSRGLMSKPVSTLSDGRGVGET
ncbi:Pectinesterase inhibitor domain [Dillenia turbinata]|uniref:Pectinesterase inhibitor domain n=1 Tax=Dillenia turbinata TaxID=194707 RepID=A0AAN8ZWA0_9MAGN